MKSAISFEINGGWVCAEKKVIEELKKVKRREGKGDVHVLTRFLPLLLLLIYRTFGLQFAAPFAAAVQTCPLLSVLLVCS